MSLPNEFTVYGSEEMLKPLILQLLAQHYDQGGEGVGGGGTYQRLPSSVVGQCLVTLLFRGKSQSIKNHRVEKTFRWVKVDPRTVSHQNVLDLANNIKTKFDNFSFVTGEKAFTYNRPDQGFNRIWGYFNSQTDAMKLFEQLLDLQSFSPDWSRLTNSNVVEPGSRFQSPPGKIQQAGVLIRPYEERPVVSVKFTRAFLKFPHVPEAGVLVDSSGGVMDVARFLAQYQD